VIVDPTGISLETVAMPASSAAALFVSQHALNFHLGHGDWTGKQVWWAKVKRDLLVSKETYWHFFVVSRSAVS